MLKKWCEEPRARYNRSTIYFPVLPALEYAWGTLRLKWYSEPAALFSYMGRSVKVELPNVEDDHVN
jgi:hypothetical protein